MAGWIDIYKIDQNPDYVHSFKDNFEKIFESNIGKIGTEYDGLKKAIETVIIAIMDELIVDWDQFRRAFIAKGNELGLSDKSDPDGFMVDYNNHFKRASAGTLTADMVELKEATFNFKKVKAKEKKKGFSTQEERAEIVQKSWKQLIQSFIKILQFYEKQNKIWVQQLTGETDKEFKHRQGLAMPINQIIKEMKKALAPIGVKSDDDIAILLKTVEDIKSGNISLDSETMQEIFINSYENQFASSSGKLIEYTMDQTIKADAILSAMLDDNSDIRKPLGVLLKDTIVGDTLVATVKINNKEVKLLASVKLTDTADVKRPYSTITDILETRKLEFADKSVSIDESTYNKINWIRKNLISLNVLSYSHGMNGEVKTANDDIDLTEFYNFEEDVALLNLIPRVLDGVYTYQEEKIIKPQFQGNPVHTALFFAKGQFIWMVDVLIGLRNLLASGNIQSGIVKTSEGKKWSDIPIKSSDLEALYAEKRKLLKDFKNKNIKIDYLTLAKDLKTLGVIDASFKGWRPIKALGTTVKYGQFLK